jgi:hypothetical protein
LSAIDHTLKYGLCATSGTAGGRCCAANEAASITETTSRQQKKAFLVTVFISVLKIFLYTKQIHHTKERQNLHTSP